MRNDFGWRGFVGLEILSNNVLLPTLVHMKSIWGFVTTPSVQHSYQLRLCFELHPYCRKNGFNPLVTQYAGGRKSMSSLELFTRWPIQTSTVTPTVNWLIKYPYTSKGRKAFVDLWKSQLAAQDLTLTSANMNMHLQVGVTISGLSLSNRSHPVTQHF